MRVLLIYIFFLVIYFSDINVKLHVRTCVAIDDRFMSVFGRGRGKECDIYMQTYADMYMLYLLTHGLFD